MCCDSNLLPNVHAIQAFWLSAAYQLEFKGEDTFMTVRTTRFLSRYIIFSLDCFFFFLTLLPADITNCAPVRNFKDTNCFCCCTSQLVHFFGGIWGIYFKELPLPNEGLDCWLGVFRGTYGVAVCTMSQLSSPACEWRQSTRCWPVERKNTEMKKKIKIEMHIYSMCPLTGFH